ncbi:MAG: flagellar export chaperone FliS [Nitrospirae bacterium]|nr:flagellar export chaperone FliS [Nitrospirota bacterium]
MINRAYALNSYTQQKVAGTTNPVDLVIMLYDGAIEFLDKAATGIKMNNLQIKLKYIAKALAIVQELDGALNFEAGGEVAVNLRNLYSFIMVELVKANLEYDADKLIRISDMLKNLRGGWVQIRNTGQ